MYYVCYTDPENGNTFQRVNDRQAMENLVDRLMAELNLDADGIHVFDEIDEII